MRVLVACECSGAVRRAFRARGHDAWSCDIQPADDGDPHHLQCDVFSVLDRGWDMMLAFWPCTRLCNSDVRWLAERNLWDDMRASAACFRRLLEYDAIPLRSLENPIPHKYALAEIGAKYDQIIQPWQFGHGETKATCLWLRGLPPLTPTNVVAGREQRIWKLPKTPDRGKLRSQTFPGIAQAMAEQWGRS